LNNIPVEEAVKEFQEEFFSYKKDVSKNHGEAADREINHWNDKKCGA